MSLRPLLSLLVKAFDVAVELGAVHAPDAPTSDLYSRKLARADKGIDLRHADRQVGRHVLESEKAGFDLRSAGATGRCPGHLPTIAPDHDRYLHLESFAAVWRTTARGSEAVRCG